MKVGVFLEKQETDKLGLRVYPDPPSSSAQDFKQAELQKGMNKEVHANERTRRNLDLAKQLDCFKEQDLVVLSSEEVVPDGESAKNK